MTPDMLRERNIVVLDLETLHSAAELATGWDDLAALGLSIGGYYDYADGQMHWFDAQLLAQTITALIVRQGLIVSFNGRGFDGPLMATCVAWEQVPIPDGPTAWHGLWQRSYDLLAEIWQADPDNKFGHNLNNLDALCAANGLGAKTGSGTLAPQWWQQGRIAEVVNYCQGDVLRTKALFELVLRSGGVLQRRTGPLTIALPVLPGETP